MNKLLVLLFAMISLGSSAQTTLLADFEDQTAGQLKINKDYTGSLFSIKPRVMENPSKTGINTSNYCVGAVNKADADWWKNFLILDLKEPVTISDQNRILNFQAYRSIQPKEMAIGFNTYEDSGRLFQGNLQTDATWEQLSIDLGVKFYGQTLKTIFIILSCNWTDPRSGWGEATYCFDNFILAAGDVQPPVKLTINSAETYQTLQDFGASDCWTTEFVGDYFSAEEKAKGARWLFSQQMDAQGNPEGIGLSCWRVNLGAGSASQGGDSNINDETRRAECYLKADGTYDWNLCDGQQWFMKQAADYGVDHFILFSNSAPIYYTKNGKANANNQNISCNLKSDCFDKFAEFLATCAKHFTDQGYKITYIDPVNEPRFDWKDGQEGSPWENSDIARLARELDNSITKRSLDVKILIPSASSWDLTYSGSGRATKQIEAFFKEGLTTYVGNLQSMERAISGHSYWTFRTNDDLRGIREKVASETEKYGICAMQTEWSMLDAAPTTDAGFPASYEAATKMDIALYMAKVIHSDLVFGNMTSWHYWTAFAQEQYSQKNRFYLIRLNASGDTGDESYGSLRNGGKLTADKNLWVLGNYSRFIRPDYRRIALDGADDMNKLLGSSWLSPDGKELVTVLVNMSRNSRNIDISVNGMTSIYAYVTDKDHNLQLDDSLTDAANLDLAARSVTTIVMQLKEPLSVNDIRIRSKTNDQAIYTLGGQRIIHPQKGVYIQGGKKRIIK